nr:MAG TPA: hypothetical protein [Inoviridae sp.]
MYNINKTKAQLRTINLCKLDKSCHMSQVTHRGGRSSPPM